MLLESKQDSQKQFEANQAQFRDLSNKIDDIIAESKKTKEDTDKKFSRLEKLVNDATAIRCEFAAVRQDHVFQQLLSDQNGVFRSAKKKTMGDPLKKYAQDIKSPTTDPTQNVMHGELENKVFLKKANGMAQSRSAWLHLEDQETNKQYQCNAVRLDTHTFLTALHCLFEGSERSEIAIGVKVKSLGVAREKLLENLTIEELWVSETADLCLFKLVAEDDSPVAAVALPKLPHPPPQRLPPLFTNTVEVGERLVSFTRYYDPDMATHYRLSSLLDVNGIQSSKASVFMCQGPGRRGHSGAGAFNSEGHLVGIHTQGTRPRRQPLPDDFAITEELMRQMEASADEVQPAEAL